MAHLIDRVNMIALTERFNHVARQRGCQYAGIASNTPFRVLFVSIMVGDQLVISLMMGELLGQLVLPSRYSSIFHPNDLYRVNEGRVGLGLTIKQIDNGPCHLELSVLEE